MAVSLNIQTEKLYRLAYGLALFTIFYNIVEGIVCTYFGYTDDALTLFGFGLDSFIETISGVGIAYMITRIRHQPNTERSLFEIKALKITGWAFYALVALLLISSVYNIYTGHKPVTTIAGIIISLVSITVMWVLIRSKIKVAKALGSQPIIADANCTKVCMYMSVVLLIGSAAYYFFSIPYIDVAGALALAYFSFKEGRECFDKAKNKACSSCAHD